MHEAERARLELGQAADRHSGRRGQAGLPQDVLGVQGTPDDLLLGHRGSIVLRTDLQDTP
jgi:hypothetical protein